MTPEDLRRLRIQGDAAAVQQLIAALDDPEVAQLAASLLGQTGSVEAVPALIAHLQSAPDFGVRALCADSLAEFDHPDVMPALLATLADESEAVVADICGALARREDPQVIPPLRRLLDHASWKVGCAAAEALLDLGCADDEIADALERLAADPASQESDYHTPRTETLARLRRHFLEVKGLPEGAAELAHALREAREAIADEDVQSRRRAPYALRAVPGIEATELLLRALEDPDHQVRARALLSLDAEQVAHGLPKIIDLLRSDSSGHVRSLCATKLLWCKDPGNFQPLVDALADSDWKVLMSAAIALADLGDRRAVPHLLPLLEHPRWSVRNFVAGALLDLGTADTRLVAALEQLSREPEAADWDLGALESQHDLEMMREMARECGDDEDEVRASLTMAEQLALARALLAASDSG